VRLLGSCPFADRSAASKAEHEVKRLPRAKKLAWFEAYGSVYARS